MGDERVTCIISNAFNGLGDSTGSDDFGYSVAWIDLNDHLDPEGLDHPELYPYSDDVSAYVKTWRDMQGCRYALAYLDADGTRSAVGYGTRADMMHAYHALESEYLAFDDTELSE
jgi:hypothetical protein